jgi:tRNA (guanine-N7-)-methyltransferase
VPDARTMTRSRPETDISLHLLDPVAPHELAPIEWKALFGSEHPVELEIGSGKGLFLAGAAGLNPRHNFLGIELSRKYALLAALRLARHQLPNAKVWRGDAGMVLARLVPPASLRAVHVYFPDPWWKRRHKKRRVFTDALVSDVERSLQKEGELRVASDVEEYFGVIQGLIAANPRFRARPLEGSDALGALPSPEYLTSFERKYRLQGRTIFRAHYVLCGTDTDTGADLIG